MEEKDKDDCTALHVAATLGSEIIVEVLLKFGAKIDEKDADEYPALRFGGL